MDNTFDFNKLFEKMVIPNQVKKVYDPACVDVRKTMSNQERLLYWVTSAGKKVRFEDLSDKHLNNIINLLQRGDRKEDDGDDGLEFKLTPALDERARRARQGITVPEGFVPAKTVANSFGFFR